MKKIAFTVALLMSAGAQANAHLEHVQLPYQQATIIPFDASPFSPQDTMPEQCRDPLVEQYIADWEAGKIDFNSIQANDSIAVDQRFCKSMDDAGNIVEATDCKLENAPVGYLWKELSDSPVVIGITNGGKSDHNPHFHGQPECYYAVSGRARTLADGEYKWMETGSYFYIPGHTIHNTPITEDEGFGVMYWYPKNAHFDGFKYYWKDDVKYLRPAEDAFERVNRLRKAAMSLKPYGENEERFK
ncbi:cupin domain-containing protein [Ferrimonas lipolytica]|uniref:Cupin domain-containing protein n=1 Tax=Ferrimonas lipolytica TaxID=2724191 RepID=A0A6H1UGD9_9GAMM|nr:cupin domain-containing protein [Ferrimonas lipolytica]QIZ78175.1 cupin domain-containing protein [Ferrimonas lipolytica]